MVDIVVGRRSNEINSVRARVGPVHVVFDNIEEETLGWNEPTINGRGFSDRFSCTTSLSSYRILPNCSPTMDSGMMFVMIATVAIATLMIPEASGCMDSPPITSPLKKGQENRSANRRPGSLCDAHAITHNKGQYSTG